jgi:predicted Ser/Thr protein kinase
MSQTADDALLALARARLATEYDVTRVLGRGGMGLVLAAVERALERQVAIKVLPSGEDADDADAARLRREAQLAAKLEHPGVVPVYRVGRVEAFDFIVMKFVDGPTLENAVARHGPLTPHAAALILRAIAGALAAAHDRGILHRDVKAANVLLDRSGRPFLTDFGIAATVQDVGEGIMTAGTPSYMAPELFAGEAPTPAADEYAMGVLGYLLVTGQLPFNADTLAGLAQQHGREKPAPLYSKLGEIPHELVRVIERALAKSPRDRHGSMAAVIAALEEIRLRPEQRSVAAAQLNRLAAGAWAIVPPAGATTVMINSKPATGDARVAPAAPAAPRRVRGVNGMMTPPRLPTAPRIDARTLQVGERLWPDILRKSLLLAAIGVALWLFLARKAVLGRLASAEAAAESTEQAAMVNPAPRMQVADTQENNPMVLGLRALEAGRSADAVPLLQRAVAADPEDVQPSGYLACALRRLGRHPEADQALARTGGLLGPWSGCARKPATVP